MNVKFVKLSENHLEMVRRWRNSPEVNRYMYTDQYITEEAHCEWYNSIKNDYTKKYWIINVDDINVGAINLYNIDKANRRCYWAYYLAEQYVRGKGIGRLIELNVLTYVFEKIDLNKLCCEVLDFNTKVVQIHEKYGSKVEGKFRQHIYKNEKFHDIYCMGILKEEWIELKKKISFEKIEFDE